MAANVGTIQLIFRLLGKDDASKALKKVDDNFKKAALEGGKVGKVFQRIAESTGGITGTIAGLIPKLGEAKMTLGALKGSGAGAGAALGTVAAAAAAAGAALLAMRGPSEEAANLELKMKRIGGSAAGAAIQFEQMQRASRGAFSLQDIAQAQSMMDAFNLPMKVTPTLLKSIQERAQMMGITTTQALDNLTVAVARQSVKIADNLGIIISATAAQEAYAEKIGKTVDRLTDKEKQAAFAAAAVEGLGKSAQQIPTGATEFARITASLSDMGMEIGGMLIPLFKILRPAVEAVGDALAIVASVARMGLQAVAAFAGPFLEIAAGIIQVLATALTPILKAITEVFGRLVSGLQAIFGQPWDDASDEIALWVNQWALAEEKLTNMIDRFAVWAGLLSETEAEQLKVFRAAQKARDEEEKRLETIKEQNLKLGEQVKALADVAKFNEKITSTLESAESAIRNSQIKILETKKAAGDLSGIESERLKTLKTQVRIEAATRNLKTQQAQIALQILEIEKEHQKVAFGEVIDEARVKDLEGKLRNLVKMQENLKSASFLASIAADKDPKPPKPPRAAARGGELDGTAQALKFYKEENAAMRQQGFEIQRQRKLKKEQLQLRVLDLRAIKASTDEQRGMIEFQRSRIKADILEIENKKDLAEHTRQLADAKLDVSLAAQLEAKSQARAAESARQTAAALSSLGAASTHLQGSGIAAMGTGIAGMTAMFLKMKDGAIGVSEAISGSGSAIAAAADQVIESKRMVAGVLAAFEMAAGFAAIETPWAAAAHFAASALFGSVAAGITGAGDSDAVTPPALSRVTERLDRDRDRAERPIVININGVVTDAQGVGLQVKRALGSMEGTGAA